MTYYSVLRDLVDLITSVNIGTLLSEIIFLRRLNGREYEHHSQYTPIAEVYQHMYTYCIQW